MPGEEMVDVLIFGASGFTGKYVIRELLKFTDVRGGTEQQQQQQQRRVGIAGRNKAKLAASLNWALQGRPSPVPVSIFEGNVEDPSSIAALVTKTKLLLNVVGPYRKYGEPVVKACVEAGVDYLDVSGEPEFIEKMKAKYDELARRQGSLIVSACGYDCVPAEMGVLHNGKQFASPALPQTCDSYLLLQSKNGSFNGNFGTWESAVLSVANMNNLREFRKSLPRRARLQIPGSMSEKPGLVHFESNSGTWAAKLPSADASVVRQTFVEIAANPAGITTSADEANSEFVASRKQKWASIQPVQVGVYASFKSLFGVFGYFLLGVVLITLAQFQMGRGLLLKYPKIFSFGIFRKGGPSEEVVENSSFQQWFVGKGFSDASQSITKSTKPDKQVVTRITGPEIGYITTPICLVQAALLVLDHRKTLPIGGVLTTGAAFGITDYQERLERNGISFEVVSIKKI